VHRVEDRLVLGARGDEVPALRPVELGGALDREVVRLGGPARPDDLLRRRADELRDLLAPASTSSSARQPNAWLFEAALPYSSRSVGSIASSTRGSSGVVAW